MYGIATSDGDILWFDNVGDYVDALDRLGPEVVMTEEPLRSSHGTSLIEAESAHHARSFDMDAEIDRIARGEMLSSAKLAGYGHAFNLI